LTNSLYVCGMEKHIAAHVPQVAIDNYWLTDPAIRALALRYLPTARQKEVVAQLFEVGELCAKRVAGLAQIADHQGPVLRRFAPTGERVDEIVYHPAYREMARVAYGSGIVAMKYHPAEIQHRGRASHFQTFLLGYLFGQAEMGLFCPLCMTD